MIKKYPILKKLKAFFRITIKWTLSMMDWFLSSTIGAHDLAKSSQTLLVVFLFFFRKNWHCYPLNNTRFGFSSIEILNYIWFPWNLREKCEKENKKKKLKKKIKEK